MGSSPLTRGKHHHAAGEAGFLGIIPAYAGKTERRLSYRLNVWDHPRLRGENKLWIACVFLEKGSSPLTRGKHRNKLIGVEVVGIIPAYAGKTSTHVPRRG